MPADELLEVGRIGRAHGVRGDLYVELITDRSERVAVGARLQGRGTWLTVEASRPAVTRCLVHFAGIADRTAAEAYVNTPLLAASLPALSPDGLYVHDLIGADVVGVDHQAYGRCVAVVACPACRREWAVHRVASRTSIDSLTQFAFRRSQRFRREH